MKCTILRLTCNKALTLHGCCPILVDKNVSLWKKCFTLQSSISIEFFKCMFVPLFTCDFFFTLNKYWPVCFFSSDNHIVWWMINNIWIYNSNYFFFYMFMSSDKWEQFKLFSRYYFTKSSLKINTCLNSRFVCIGVEMMQLKDHHMSKSDSWSWK